MTISFNLYVFKNGSAKKFQRESSEKYSNNFTNTSPNSSSRPEYKASSNSSASDSSRFSLGGFFHGLSKIGSLIKSFFISKFKNTYNYDFDSYEKADEVPFPDKIYTQAPKYNPNMNTGYRPKQYTFNVNMSGREELNFEPEPKYEPKPEPKSEPKPEPAPKNKVKLNYKINICKNDIIFNIEHSIKNPLGSLNILAEHIEKDEDFMAYTKFLNPVKQDDYGVMDCPSLLKLLQKKEQKTTNNLLAAYHIMQLQALCFYIQNPGASFKEVAYSLHLLGTEIMVNHRADLSKKQLHDLINSNRYFQVIT